MQATRSAAILGGQLVRLGLCVVACQALGAGRPARAGAGPAKPDPVALGYEIFNREWMPDDPRSHGGDGLGPVYNDSSCVACHNAGGSGGAGPVSKNIDILNASRGNLASGNVIATPPSQGETAVSQPRTASLDPLVDVHAGFRTSRTVVLHKFGTDPNYDSWRSQVLVPSASRNIDTAGVITFETTPVAVPASAPPIQFQSPVRAAVLTTENGNIEIRDLATAAANGRGVDEAGASRAAGRMAEIRASLSASNPAAGQPPRAVGTFLVTRSQRNPTPLFGLGLIEAIPEAAIEAMARRQAKESPEIQGRVGRLKDGRIGRLGWKGQTANAEDFVLNACAVEVGLEVPDHHQALIPQAPKYQPPGLDLTAEECAALIAYVRSLPRPVERQASGVEEANFLGAGKATFASIGCAGCHAPSVGKVAGIYSDLLLHDMGPEMADSGSYGESSDDGGDEPLVPLLADGQPVQPQPAQSQPTRGATRQEWRTPPLWGFRDSGPYLHDGRAQTLEQAVAVHGGQGAASAQRFFHLTPRERLQLEAFLKSLVAPPASELIARAGN